MEERRSWKDIVLPSPGPYEAEVVSHFDPYQMGGLEVQLLKSSSAGNTPDLVGQTIPVQYLSPFYGVTNVNHNTKNEGYKDSQKSYGMWMVPPDTGTTVLVLFSEGRISKGYWIGCVQDKFMNFMIPDGKASTTYNVDRKNLPVGEFNKLIDTPMRRTEDPTRFLKPINQDFVDMLTRQGLVEDYTRGLTTSSARRERPSAVFGISTPGPLDKRDGAPKGPYGQKDLKAEVFVNRLGGSSFVMDDGDEKYLRKKPANEGPMEYAYVLNGEKGEETLPANELVRIRTRTGHQILLHNTEDLIYIGNAKGTSWIELTSDGKIDIYAKDSISVHTENDINFKADRDFNIEVGRNFNVKTNNDINLESVNNHQLIVGRNNKITTLGTFDINTEGNTKIAVTNGNFDLNTSGNNAFTSGGTTDMNSVGVHTETASTIHHNGPTARIADIAVLAQQLPTHELPGKTEFAKEEVIMRRVPQHEPWPHHENIDPALFKPDLTSNFAEDPMPVPEIPALYDVFKGGKK